MNGSDCGCRRECLLIAVSASIVVAIVAAVLSFSAIITVLPAFLWVALGSAAVVLLVLLVSSLFLRGGYISNCLCGALPVLLTGILGAILTSVVLLAISFAATSVLGEIITGALAGLVTLIITSLVCLLRCTLGCCINDD